MPNSAGFGHNLLHTTRHVSSRACCWWQGLAPRAPRGREACRHLCFLPVQMPLEMATKGRPFSRPLLSGTVFLRSLWRPSPRHQPAQATAVQSTSCLPRHLLPVCTFHTRCALGRLHASFILDSLFSFGLQITQQEMTPYREGGDSVCSWAGSDTRTHTIPSRDVLTAHRWLGEGGGRGARGGGRGPSALPQVDGKLR